MKRIAFFAIALLCVALAATAATKTVTGKVTAIDGTKVSITIDGERADWVKKNGFVKFKVGTGKIIETAAADASPFTIVVNIKKASEFKVDDVVTFEKGLAVSGC
jgi:translation initiation factor 2B subunit (eIF-2B alpha/beta/delta family)